MNHYCDSRYIANNKQIALNIYLKVFLKELTVYVYSGRASEIWMLKQSSNSIQKCLYGLLVVITVAFTNFSYFIVP